MHDAHHGWKHIKQNEEPSKKRRRQEDWKQEAFTLLENAKTAVSTSNTVSEAVLAIKALSDAAREFDAKYDRSICWFACPTAGADGEEKDRNQFKKRIVWWYRKKETSHSFVG
jgi:hypothetical protein